VLLVTLFNEAFLTPRLTGLVKQYGKKHSNAENFVLIMVSIWQVGSRWHTSDFHTVTLDI
jgi:hypothetical protein